MRTAVVTTVKGRATHLRQQMRGFAFSTEQADRHIVVAVDDEDVAHTIDGHDRRTRLVTFNPCAARIPVAAARNLGAQAAIDDGAELLIFLDVDCIPSPTMVARYRSAARDRDHSAALLCGPVTYLPAPGPAGYDVRRLGSMVDPHPGRPAPQDGDIVVSDAYELFWSLSFAVTNTTWQRIGGFCTRYMGYGAEDTDFAQMAAAEHITLRWIGGAHALHQYHPVSDPPTEHLHDIVRNADIFHQRWGWWPMRGWLDSFQERGLISRDRRGRPRLL